MVLELRGRLGRPKKKRLNLNEFKLLEKYKGMLFYDEDEGEVFAVCESNLEWKKKDKNDRSTPCYAILATPHQIESHAVSGDDSDDDDDEVEPVCYHINDVLHDMIAYRLSGHPSDVRLVGASN